MATITRTTGIHGRTMLPINSRIAASTPSSIRNDTSNEPIVETTKTSRGKYTFLIRFEFPINEPMDPVMPPCR